MPLPILVKMTDGYGQVLRGKDELYGEEDAVIGYSFDHNVSRVFEDGDDDENVNIWHEPISFVKEVDNTSPILNQILADGDDMKEIEFTFYIHDNTRESAKYYSIIIEKAQIVKISPFSKMTFLGKNEPYRLMERVEFSYKTISWIYHKVNGSIMMAMDAVQDVPEAEPQNREDYLFQKNLANERKNHPGIDDATLQDIARQNTIDDLLWEKEKNKHWVEMKYLYPDDSGVVDIPYRVKLPDGKEETGVFAKDTVLRFENLPAGEVSAEFGKPVEEELFQIRKEIKSTLNSILVAKQKETDKVLADLEKQGLIEKSGSFVKKISSGAWEGAKGLVELADTLGKISMLFSPTEQTGNALKATYRAFQNGDESKDSWIEQFSTQWNAIRHEEYIEAIGFDPSEIDPKQIAEAYELVALIYDDSETYSMFLDFAEGYVKAQNRLDWAEMAGGAAFEIILGIVLAALTGGTSAVAQVGKKAQGLISKLGPKFKNLFALLKKKKLNIKVNGKVDVKYVKKAKIPDGSELSKQKIKKKPNPKSKHAEVNAENPDASLPDTDKAHPVQCITGSVVETQTDFELGGSRLPLIWERHYSSGDINNSGLGAGWRTPADIRLTQDPKTGIITFYDGSRGGTVFPNLPDKEPVLEVANGSMLLQNQNHYIVQTKTGQSYVFPKKTDFTEIHLEIITDQTDNFIHFKREGTTLKEIATSSGQKVEVHSENGLIKMVTLINPDGSDKKLVEYEYDYQTGDLIAVYDELSNATHYEYENHLVKKITNKVGLPFHYKYNEDGKCIHTFSDGGLYDYKFDYLESVSETRITNSLGHTETFKYDDEKRPIAVKDHENNITTYGYDEQGRPSSVTDPLGNTTRYSYDNSGNMTDVLRPDKSKVLMEYLNDNPIKITDPNGNIWQQTWLLNGLLESRVSPQGGKTLYGYNEKGDLITITDPNGGITTFEPDELGNIAGITNPGGQKSAFDFDTQGNIVSAVDPAGQKTTYIYDEKSRITEILKPSGKTTSCQYDAEDNIIEYIDEAGQSTKLEYTGLNEVSKRTNPDGTTVKYSFDTEEQLTSVTNERGESFQFSRDHTGRITEETDYWGNERTYKYDKIGRLKYSIDPLKRATFFQFDSMNRLKQKSFSDGSLESFNFDAAGNLVSHKNNSALTENFYDSENCLIKEIQNNNTVEHEYDLNGNRTRRLSSNGNDVRFEYDNSNNASAISINGKDFVKIKRDEKGLPIKESFANGLAKDYHYNSDGLLTHQAIFTEHSNDLSIERKYEYDPIENLTSRIDSEKGASYFTYNPVGQITKAINPENKIQEYLHDPAGDLFKRSEKEETKGSRHLEYQDTNYHFNAAGNLIERKGEQGKTTFEWDFNNRLSAAETDGVRTKMVYDAKGRRLSKTTDGKTTSFTWDGDQLLSDNVDGKSPREFVYYPNSFKPLAMIDKDKNVFYYHNDSVGLPQEITDASNNVVWSARYDALGNIEKQYVEEIENPLRFQGQYFDPEIDLSYNRHRYFDPKTCSFISRDPLGLAAGVNLYSYAPNVWGWIDPMGLCKKDAAKNTIDIGDSVSDLGVTFEGTLYRSVSEGRNPLEIHPLYNTEKAVHRYTGEGQGGLYLGSSQRIVNSEFTSNGGSLDGLVNYKYDVKIEGLLDLTDPVVRKDLGVTLDDLVRTGGDKKEWRYDVTNPLGRYAEDSGYNGIIAPAAQADGGINAILFKPELVK